MKAPRGCRSTEAKRLVAQMRRAIEFSKRPRHRYLTICEHPDGWAAVLHIAGPKLNEDRMQAFHDHGEAYRWGIDQLLEDQMLERAKKHSPLTRPRGRGYSRRRTEPARPANV